MRITCMDQAKQIAIGRLMVVWFVQKYPSNLAWFRHDKSLSYSSWAFGRLSIIRFD